MAKYMPYPKEDDSRIGCKVGWLIYVDRAAAEKAAAAARHNAEIDAARGYDFGFQCPGTLTKLEDGRFEVCIS